MTIVDRQGRLFHRFSLLDAIIMGCAFALLPIVQYGYRNAAEHGQLRINSIQPSVVTAGTSEALTILGSGFDADTEAQVGELTFKRARFVNPVHLKVAVPLEVGPGSHRILIRNGRGRLVISEHAISVIWKPLIEKVTPSRLTAGWDDALTITGRYFEKNCTVTIGSRRLENRVEYVDPTQVRIKVLPKELMPGTYAVTVTNPNGNAGVLPDAVQVVVRASPPPPVVHATPKPPQPPAVIPSAPKVTTPPPQGNTESKWQPAIVLVTCAFPKRLPALQRRLLRRGAEGWDDDGVVVARIVDVLGDVPGVMPVQPAGGRKIVTRQSQEGFVLASLLVASRAIDTRDGAQYLFQDQPLQVGSPLSIRFHPMVMKIIVLTNPIPMAGGREMLHPHE